MSGNTTGNTIYKFSTGYYDVETTIIAITGFQEIGKSALGKITQIFEAQPWDKHLLEYIVFSFSTTKYCFYQFYHELFSPKSEHFQKLAIIPCLHLWVLCKRKIVIMITFLLILFSRDTMQGESAIILRILLLLLELGQLLRGISCDRTRYHVSLLLLLHKSQDICNSSSILLIWRWI